MKKLFICISIICNTSLASEMTGFGANYYDDDTDNSNFTLNKETTRKISPDIVVGDNLFMMAFNTLDELAKSVNTPVNYGEHASWICLTKNSLNHWFISGNETDGGYLNAIAMANDGRQTGCIPYKGNISISIKNTPSLSEFYRSLPTYIDKNNIGNYKAISFCNRKPGDYTQLHCLKYYVDKGKVRGTLLMQKTTS